MQYQQIGLFREVYEAPDYGSRNALMVHPAVRLHILPKSERNILTDVWALYDTWNQFDVSKRNQN